MYNPHNLFIPFRLLPLDSVWDSTSYLHINGNEYWFPRPVNDNAPGENMTPLVILGEMRQVGGPDYEMGTTDDSVINLAISKALKEFLPTVYPEGWFQRGKEPEMEWVINYLRSWPALTSRLLRIKWISWSGKVIGIFQRWSCDLLSSTKRGLTSLKTSSGERLEESSIFSMRELLKYSSMFRPR